MHLIKELAYRYLYDISAFMLHFIYISFFLWTFSFSMNWEIMTSPRYYDVTHFLTDAKFDQHILVIRLELCN